jgi:hypothetical protein
MLQVGTMRVTFLVRKAFKQTTPKGYLEPQAKNLGFFVF